MPFDQAQLLEQIAQIQHRIDQAAQRSQRDPASVRLIAVTKTHPMLRVNAVLAAGIHDVGENRVQEAEEKIALQTPEAVAQTRWHLIGHLQRNKARRAAKLFSLIHSIDSLKLAEILNRIVDEEANVIPQPLPILLQVNVSGERSKDGFELTGGVRNPAWLDFVADVRAIAQLPLIDLQGFMTIAPYSDDVEGVVRPCFRALRDVRDALEQQLDRPLPELSMGMSGDFEVAIEEGSTFVRVGTALFGAR
ncbi:YggS family pyridoxal phosphate-dependent enzyme [Herpetosiphon llansteffanensis]|uniref:YggS family pyridoxal phosphate-dependent enzyme n=1 Tax=Herpetosiphon llansteffanensis TaxID=2094568 RepID=UPI000D7C78A9|nr:YggS family pyridoxal phosphate-dependent enzyme [Herpetosiphon llansteffanensis]